MLTGLNRFGRNRLPVVLTLMAGAASAWGAEAERRIDCGVAVTNDAVVITRATVGNTVVPCMAAPGPPDGRGPYQAAPPFLADDDWLQNVTIYLFNRTNKTIVFAYLVVGFPQTGDGLPGSPQRAFQIIQGRRPAVANFSPRTGEPMRNEWTPISFAPKQTLAIHLADYIDRIRERIRDRLFAPVTSIKVSPQQFIFEDGMSWGPGAFLIPDQEHPGKWMPMPRDYFPGNPHAFWPPDRLGTGR